MREIVESHQSLNEMVRPLLRIHLGPCCAIATNGNLISPTAAGRGTSRAETIRWKNSLQIPVLPHRNLNATVCEQLTRSGNRTSLVELLTHLLLWAAFSAIASHFFGL